MKVHNNIYKLHNYCFEVNTKYISWNVLKIYVISWVHSTSEIADIPNTWDEIVLIFTEKK